MGGKEKTKRPFDLKVFLSEAGGEIPAIEYPTNGQIFRQGDPANGVFYIKEGKVKLAVVSRRGKEAVVGILTEGDFFGEGCLAGQQVRTASAIAISKCTVLQLDKPLVIRLLGTEPEFSSLFLSHLLTRNIKFEADLVDQLFNSSEKRLARVLLLLANYGKQDLPQTVIPKISQETLAEIVGTTRSRVNFFMNRFRKLGFIHYNGRLEIHSSLLNVILHD